MHNFRMTLEEAQRRDLLIFELAFYDVTQGMMTVEANENDLLALKKEACRRFNVFKSQIKSGEFTLEELEQNIVLKHAAIPDPKMSYSIDDVDDFVKDAEKEGDKSDAYNKGQTFLDALVNSVFSGQKGVIPISINPDGKITPLGQMGGPVDTDSFEEIDDGDDGEGEDEECEGGVEW